MTLTDADNQIAQWHDKQALIEENLRSFVQLPAFERLASNAAQIPDPDSRQKAATALEVFQGLQAQQAALAQTIGRAKELRDALPRIMPSKQTLQEIEHLLNGNSIQLASSPTPPQRRELLRDIEQAEWISPARMLEIMLDSFRFVRDTVLTIDDAVVNQQRDATDRLANATTMLRQLRELRDRGRQLLAERELKVEGIRSTAALPCSEEELSALETWLNKLQSAMAKAQYANAAAGLSKWTNAATELLAQAQSSTDADEAMLRERRELRGLFESLVAKATNQGRAEDPPMVATGREIRRLLSTRPTPIAQVRELVSRYQHSLM
jgi:hypothetical protein